MDPAWRFASRTKWDDGYIEVRAAATADPRVAVNEAQTISMALRAARVLAYQKLLETVEGVQIDGTTIVSNAMIENSVVKATVTGRIRGARIVDESHIRKPDGSIWAEVTLGLPLYGRAGLSPAVAP